MIHVNKKTPLEIFLQSVNLPVLPEIALSLVDTLNDEDFSIDVVEKLIGRDTGITAAVIKQANSARYGLPTKVSSVNEAMRLIGFNAVRAIALGSSVANAFPVTGGIDVASFWDSSDKTAHYAQKLALILRQDGASAWLCGFMVRVGELLIAQHDQGAISHIEQEPRLPGVRWKREDVLFGLTEGQIISELAKMWNFPDEVVVALRECANPLSEDWPFHKLSGIIHLASLLSDVAMYGDLKTCDLDVLLPQSVMDALGLTVMQVECCIKDSSE